MEFTVKTRCMICRRGPRLQPDFLIKEIFESFRVRVSPEETPQTLDKAE